MGTELTESRPHGPVITKQLVDDSHRLHSVASARAPLVSFMVVDDLHCDKLAGTQHGTTTEMKPMSDACMILPAKIYMLGTAATP